MSKKEKNIEVKIGAKLKDSFKKAFADATKSAKSIGDEFDKFEKTIKKATNSASKSQQKLGKELAREVKKIQSLTTATKKAEASTSSLSRKVETQSMVVRMTSQALAEATSDLSRLEKQYNEADEKSDKLSRALNKQRNYDRKLKIEYQSAKARLEDYKDALSIASNRSTRLNNELKKTRTNANSISKRINGATGSFKRFSARISKTHKQLKKLTSKLSKTAKKMLHLDNISKHFNSTSAYGLFRMTALFMIFMQLITFIVDGFNDLVKHSNKVNESVSQLYSAFVYLRNALTTAFAPILNVVSPILSNFMVQLADAITNVGMFFAVLTGQKTYTKAVYEQKDYAASLDDTADSADKAKDKIEKLKKTIHGYDELHVRQDPKSDSDTSGSGNSGATGGSKYEEVVNPVSSFAEMVKEAWKNADFTEVGRTLNKKLADALDSIDWPAIQAKAEKIGKSLATLFNGLLENEQTWYKAGNAIAEAVNTVIAGLDSFVNNFDFKSLGQSMAEFMHGILDIDWKKLTSSLSTGIKGLFDTMFTFITTLDTDKIAQSVVDLISGIDVWGILLKALTAAVALMQFANDLIGSLFKKIIEAIKNTDWGEVAKNMWDKLKEALGQLFGLFFGDSPLVLNIGLALLAGWEKIKELWDSFKETTVTKWTEVKEKVAGAIDKIKAAWNTFKDGEVVKKWLDAQKKEAWDICQKAWDAWKESSVCKWLTSSPKEAWNTWKDNWNNWKEATVKKWVSSDKKKAWTTYKEAWKNWKEATVKKWVSSDKKKAWTTYKEAWKNWKEATVKKWVTAGKKKDWTKVKDAWDKLKSKTLKVSLNSDGFKKALNAVIDKINSFIKSIKKLKIGKKQIFKDLAYIPRFATGGFPEDGLFMANSGELVGKFSNGKTAVANNEQIVEGIKAGVIDGMMQVVMATRGNNASGNDNSQIILMVDSQELARATLKGQRQLDSRYNPVSLLY